MDGVKGKGRPMMSEKARVFRGYPMYILNLISHKDQFSLKGFGGEPNKADWTRSEPNFKGRNYMKDTSEAREEEGAGGREEGVIGSAPQ